MCGSTEASWIKILERAARTPYPTDPGDAGEPDPDYEPRYGEGGKRRRRRSVLEDLLDFG